MANRRSRIHEFYSPRYELRSLQERAAAAAAAATGRYGFHGASLVNAVVVRTDLNGFSAWARDKPAAVRATVLDNFFTRLIPTLTAAGGVYFRDEGDCIVSLFSDYFGDWSYQAAEAFCLTAGTLEYGAPRLSAKSVVVCGTIAIYQKAHEVGSDDWSAEGDPFVRAARLETAISSNNR